MHPSQIQKPSSVRTARVTLWILAAALLLLGPRRAVAQCTNIVGTWAYSESGSITLQLTASDGESDSETDPVSGSGTVTISQAGGCTFQYTPVPANGSSLLNQNLTPSQLASLVRTLTVNGTNVQESGIFAIVNTAAAEAEGLTITSVNPNSYSGSGQITTSDGTTTITINGSGNLVVTGTASSGGETISFTITATGSSTATLVSNSLPQLQVTTTTVPGVATGQAYKTALAASGGSGSGYSWEITSGSLPEGFSLSSSGVISSSGSPAAEQGTYNFTVQVTDSADDVATRMLTLLISCPVTVNLTMGGNFASTSGSPTFIEATFPVPNGESLVSYAQGCGFANFDWVQTISQWPSSTPLYAQDAPSVPITAPPPFSDPPQGGYTYQFPPSPDAQLWSEYLKNFAQAYPYYYSPLDIASGCAMVGTNGCDLAVSTSSALNFYDAPFASGCASSTSCIVLTTELVGVCQATSPECAAEGPSASLTQWTWQTNFNGSSGGITQGEPINIFTPTLGSGSGGITLISINGVPVPTVTVSPSASPVTTAQTLSVTVSVSGGTGSPVPTGSVVLTSGVYTSAAATLTNGAATFQVQASALGTGNDLVTAAYTPDNASAADYTKASGSAAVTVTSAGTPGAGLSTTSLAFSPVMVNAVSAAQSVTVTNSGTGSLSFTAIAVTGPFAIAASGTTCSTSNPVAAGGTCTAAVTFSPTTAGAASGSLVFTDNAPSNPQTVALSGTGQDFTLAAASGSLTGASVAPGQAAIYSLSLTGEDGFNQSVSFTCAGSPANATCIVTPNPVTAAGSATTVTVTVTTTAALIRSPRFRHIPPPDPAAPGVLTLWALAWLAVATALVLTRRGLQPGTPRRPAPAVLAVGCLLLLALAACGGGGGGTSTNVTPTNTGTPSGAFTLTVTGTASSGSAVVSHNVTLNLNVS